MPAWNQPCVIRTLTIHAGAPPSCIRTYYFISLCKLDKERTWWRHQMETFSVLLALCEGNPPVTGGFPSQKSVTQSFDVCFDLHTAEQTIERRRWFEAPSRSLRRHCKDTKTKSTCSTLMANIYKVLEIQSASMKQLELNFYKMIVNSVRSSTLPNEHGWSMRDMSMMKPGSPNGDWPKSWPCSFVTDKRANKWTTKFNQPRSYKWLTIAK